MSYSSSTEIDRTAINAAFMQGHLAAAYLARDAINNLNEIRSHRAIAQAYAARKGLLDNVLSTVPHIGNTVLFLEMDIPRFIYSLPDFSIRTDWPVVLFSWYAAWAHNAIVNPGENKLENALEALRMNVTNGRSAVITWKDQCFKASETLQIAIMSELRDTHGLVGPWRISANLDYERGHIKLKGIVCTSGIRLIARVPHCNEAFKRKFTYPMVLEGDTWELETTYNSRLMSEADKLQQKATEMVELAVRESIPLRIQADALRAKMTTT